MSVTAWEAINDRSGEETYQDDGTTVTTRSKTWRVKTNAASDDDYTVMADASAPKIGSSHPSHSNCRCVSRSCQPESRGQKQQWLFTAKYSTKFDIRENPLDDPAKTEWSTETFQTPVWETIDGKGIVNSAGDPFDPPAEKDDSRWTSITRKNVATSVPAWMFAFQDAVNSDSFTVDGIGVGSGWAKISAIHLSEIQERNEVEYRVLTLTIHYRGEGDTGTGSYGSGSGSDSIMPWDLSILDAGFREIDDQGSGSGDVRNIKNANGEDVSAPVPLDGDGHKLDNPTMDNAVFLQFEIYRSRAFALISSMFS